MQIRNISDNDFEPISNLIRKTLKLSNLDYSNEQIENWINIYTSNKIKILSNKWNFIVVELNNQIIGVGAYYKNEIHTLFVDPEYQNQGIGRNILEKLEDEIKKKYSKSLILGASINALDFYNKLGYKTTNTDHNEFNMKIFKMQKNLGLNK